MSETGEAKVTDVGVTKPTDILLRSVEGSPAYMAPEVLLGTQNQTNKIDIYSMALIFWEMWYGVDVAGNMNREILHPGFKGNAFGELKKRMANPKGGWRPSFQSGERPPDDLVAMMRKGWHEIPETRPSANELAVFFENMLKKT